MLKASIVLSILLSFQVQAELVGKALLEYSIFKIDVYEIEYHRETAGQERLKLNYKRDVEKKHSLEGWKVGLGPLQKKLNPEQKKKLEWIFNNVVDLAEKDTFEIVKKGDEVKFYKNKQLLAQTKDKVVARAVFYPWLGDEPIDQTLKNKLLGKKG